MAAIGDHDSAVLGPLTWSLMFFELGEYVQGERPGLHHLPVSPWDKWWAGNFGGKVSIGAAPASRDPSRGPDLLFLKGGEVLGTLGVENAHGRLGERMDALRAYRPRGRGPEPLFTVLWTWASAVEQPPIDPSDECWEFFKDDDRPYYDFDAAAPDGAPLIEKARGLARGVSRGSDTVWVTAVRKWKKGKDRGCEGLYIYVAHHGRDGCFIPRPVYAP